MGELEVRLNSILSDPGQMEKIAGLARSLMGGEAAAPEPSAPDAGLLKKLGGLMAQNTQTPSREQALLAAMRPWLSERRREKMDRALQLARMARLAQLAMGELGGGNDDQSL
ncbi:MAG: hypothetical protein Q4E45_07995 [Eubacteriales bacterium]|nr:hypothetical protein [Eubacteriales bacterium]